MTVKSKKLLFEEEEGGVMQFIWSLAWTPDTCQSHVYLVKYLKITKSTMSCVKGPYVQLDILMLHVFLMRTSAMMVI